MKSLAFFLVLFCTWLPGNARAQSNTAADLELVRAKATEIPSPPPKPKATFGLIGKSFVSRYNPFSLLLSSALYGYQKVMSGQIASNCPYQLSCSNFAKVSLSEYGLFKGTALAVDRVTRCNKLSSADIHPIRFNEKGKIDDHPLQYSLKH